MKHLWLLGAVLVTLSLSSLPISTMIMGLSGIVLIIVSAVEWLEA